MTMSKYQYLPGIIVYALFLCFLIYSIVYYCFSKQLKDNAKKSSNTDPVSTTSALYKLVSGLDFYNSYHSYGGSYASIWTLVLLLQRIAWFCFFLVYPCIILYVRNDGQNYYYFTVWNIDLICIYYFLAIIASCIGLYTEWSQSISYKEINWSQSMTDFGNAINIILEVAAGTALFVTIVVFALLNREGSLTNTSQHLITTISFLTEFSLNSMLIRYEHLIFNVMWAMFYTIFIWPAVVEDLVRKWPYFFLRTGIAGSFFWYTLLFVLDVLFYLMWYGFSILKVKYLRPDLSNESKGESSNGDITCNILNF